MSARGEMMKTMFKERGWPRSQVCAMRLREIAESTKLRFRIELGELRPTLMLRSPAFPTDQDHHHPPTAVVGSKWESHDRRGVSGRPRGPCPAGRVLALGSELASGRLFGILRTI